MSSAHGTIGNRDGQEVASAYLEHCKTVFRLNLLTSDSPAPLYNRDFYALDAFEITLKTLRNRGATLSVSIALPAIVYSGAYCSTRWALAYLRSQLPSRFSRSLPQKL